MKFETLQTQFVRLSFSPEATVKQHVKIQVRSVSSELKETGKEESFF